MNWISMINTIACFALLYFLFAASILAHKTSQKIALVPLTIIVTLQLIDPVVGWIPELVWPSVALNVAIAFAAVVLWKQVRFK